MLLSGSGGEGSLGGWLQDRSRCGASRHDGPTVPACGCIPERQGAGFSAENAHSVKKCQGDAALGVRWRRFAGGRVAGQIAMRSIAARWAGRGVSNRELLLLNEM